MCSTPAGRLGLGRGADGWGAVSGVFRPPDTAPGGAPPAPERAGGRFAVAAAARAVRRAGHRRPTAGAERGPDLPARAPAASHRPELLGHMVRTVPLGTAAAGARTAAGRGGHAGQRGRVTRAGAGLPAFECAGPANPHRRGRAGRAAAGHGLSDDGGAWGRRDRCWHGTSAR